MKGSPGGGARQGAACVQLNEGAWSNEQQQQRRAMSTSSKEMTCWLQCNHEAQPFEDKSEGAQVGQIMSAADVQAHGIS